MVPPWFQYTLFSMGLEIDVRGMGLGEHWVVDKERRSSNTYGEVPIFTICFINLHPHHVNIPDYRDLEVGV